MFLGSLPNLPNTPFLDTHSIQPYSSLPALPQTHKKKFRKKYSKKVIKKSFKELFYNTIYINV